jgi:hypothetical protein
MQPLRRRRDYGSPTECDCQGECPRIKVFSEEKPMNLEAITSRVAAKNVTAILGEEEVARRAKLTWIGLESDVEELVAGAKKPWEAIDVAKCLELANDIHTRILNISLFQKRVGL